MSETKDREKVGDSVRSAARAYVGGFGGPIAALVLLFLQFRGVEVNSALAILILLAFFVAMADAIWASQISQFWTTGLKSTVTLLLVVACGVLWIVTEPSRTEEPITVRVPVTAAPDSIVETPANTTPSTSVVTRVPTAREIAAELAKLNKPETPKEAKTVPQLPAVSLNWVSLEDMKPMGGTVAEPIIRVWMLNVNKNGFGPSSLFLESVRLWDEGTAQYVDVPGNSVGGLPAHMPLEFINERLFVAHKYPVGIPRIPWGVIRTNIGSRDGMWQFTFQLVPRYGDERETIYLCAKRGKDPTLGAGLQPAECPKADSRK